MSLTFDNLRQANVHRIGHFKNSKGEPAHTTTNGSDWTPAQWVQATLGEFGEFCQVRIDFEAGDITATEYAVHASKEIADVQIYLDIMAKRALDEVESNRVDDDAQILMHAVAHLGVYANARKKYDRGDIDAEKFGAIKQQFLSNAISCLQLLDESEIQSRKSVVTKPHPDGIDLGTATIDKFNEVSARVGSPVTLSHFDWHFEPQR